MNMHVEPQTVIDFATFLSRGYDDLEPWNHANRAVYTPPLSAFAGDEDADDLVYEFEYLTTEEFEGETGKTLDPNFDPGEAKTVDAIYSVPHPVDLVPFETNIEQGRNWAEYYLARGAPSSVGTIVEDNPGAGPAPWAEALYQDWTDAVDMRTQECTDVREEIAFLMPILDRAAQEYTDTDLENAAGIDLAAYDGSDVTPSADREAESSPGADRE